MFFSNYIKKIISKTEELKKLEVKLLRLNLENKEHLKTIAKKEKAIKRIIKEKSEGFPWLANAISEFYEYHDKEIHNYLISKSRPAYKAAVAVSVVSSEKKTLRKQAKIAKNFVEYYESLFPWITEYVGEDLDELLKGVVESDNQTDEHTDPVLKYIPNAEYNKLSISERNQKALDRYVSSRKQPWQIGRDYERYIGYLYEKSGYSVEYYGIEKGFEDLGRDLICTKGGVTEIVQCKYWAKHKVIHEKHINQLYGTVVKHYLDMLESNEENYNLSLFPDLIKNGNIKATFITSTTLSETAQKFADALGIEVNDEEPMGAYPLIKCNIGSSGEKIYHLPFDQQYDKTVIKNKGEFYARTVLEAEEKGFRRAFKWRGNE